MVEVFDGVLRCIDLLESYSFKDEHVQVALKEGEKEAITEAPRGLLRHWYRINRMGIVEAGDIVTPTSHNFSNIEHDLRKLVALNEGKTRDELRLLCEKLVRAYDPCFSCSVH